MKSINILLCISLLLAPLSVPARADFKYTETSQVTGGSLKSMVKVAGIFSKQARDLTKPMSSSRAVKGDRMRTDESDGSVQIIDLEGRRFIHIDTMKKTYYVMTFDQMKQAMEQAQQQLQQVQKPQQQPDPQAKDANAQVNMQFHVTPGTATREVMGQTTNEMKLEMDMLITAQQQADPSTQQQAAQASGKMSTTVDEFVAPSIAGYDEFGEFYKRMAKEIDWTPPSNFHVDPRADQGLSELQKNSAQLKGLPMLQYVSMTMVATNPDGTPVQPADTSTNGSGSGNGSGGSSSTASNDSNSSSFPTSPGDAIAKGFGGLFNKKKKQQQQDDAAAQNSQNPPPPSTPGSLMEMTIQVTELSTDSLDSSYFDIPAGYAQMQPPAELASPAGGAPGTRR